LKKLKLEYLVQLQAYSSTMREYTNCLTLYQMKWLYLFDDMPYGEIKHIIHGHDENDYEVDIQDIELDECDYRTRKTQFTFDLEHGEGIYKHTKTYKIIKEYDASSPMAMFIDDLCLEESDEEESDEEVEQLCKNCDPTYTGKKSPYCIMGHKNCGKGLPHITENEDFMKSLTSQKN